MASDAVLIRSEKMPENTPTVKGKIYCYIARLKFVQWESENRTIRMVKSVRWANCLVIKCHLNRIPD